MRDPDPPRLTTSTWTARVTALRSVGFNGADADRWGRDPLHLDVAELVALAIEYRDHGFKVVEAIRWRNHGYPPDAAAQMAARDWTPRLSVDLQVRAFVVDTAAARLHPSRGKRRPHTAEDWLSLGLTPDITLLYLRTGHTFPEAVELEQRRSAGEDVIGALRLLEALQGKD